MEEGVEVCGSEGWVCVQGRGERKRERERVREQGDGEDISRTFFDDECFINIR